MKEAIIALIILIAIFWSYQLALSAVLFAAGCILLIYTVVNLIEGDKK